MRRGGARTKQTVRVRRKRHSSQEEAQKVYVRFSDGDGLGWNLRPRFGGPFDPSDVTERAWKKLLEDHYPASIENGKIFAALLVNITHQRIHMYKISNDHQHPDPIATLQYHDDSYHVEDQDLDRLALFVTHS